MPLARFLSPAQLLSLLESATFDNVARAFLTEDRKQTLLFLRLRETGAHEGRRQVIERMEETHRSKRARARNSPAACTISRPDSGLSSPRASYAAWVAFSCSFYWWPPPWAATLASPWAMVVALVPVPVFVLGLFGLLALPVDIISSPRRQWSPSPSASTP